MKLSEISSILEDAELKLDGEFDKLALVTSKTDRDAMVFIEDRKYIENIDQNVTCVICSQELYKYLPNNIGIIVSKTPKIDFFIIHNHLSDNKKYARKNYETKIGINCNISSKSTLSDINVTIGNNVIVEENVIIRANTTIGDNSIIRAGSIIGGEGFDCKRVGQNSILMVKHSGGVIIGNNVEIQQNCCVDRAIFPWDDTTIGDYTKTDNFVHIAHADKIGKRCLFAANAVISGSVTIEDDCWIGVGATISNGLTIGKSSRVNIGAVVTKDVDAGKSVSGNFAIEHSKLIKFIKKIR